MNDLPAILDLASPYIASGMAGAFLGMAVMALVAANRSVYGHRYRWALYRITDICRREQFRSPLMIKIQRTAEDALGGTLADLNEE